MPRLPEVVRILRSAVRLHRVLLMSIGGLLWVALGINALAAAPSSLDVYGSTTAELPALDAHQTVGLEFSTSGLSVGGELSAALPSLSIMGISAFGEGQLLDFSSEFLGDSVMATAEVDSKLELWHEARLDVGLRGEVRWGSLLAAYESQSSLSPSFQASGNHRVQGEYLVDRLLLRSEIGFAGSATAGWQVSIAGQADVLDIVLGEGSGRLVLDIDSGIDVVAAPKDSWKTWLKASGTWRRLRVASQTRLEAHPAGIGDQSFEVELSDIRLPFLGTEARLPLIGALELNVRVLPALTAQVLAHMDAQLPGSDVGMDAILGFDGRGLRNASLLLEGEGMWAGEGGSLTASIRIDRTIWSRNAVANPSLHLTLAASSDPSGAGLAAEEARTLPGSRLNAEAGVRMGAAGIRLWIGGSFAFRARLLGGEGSLPTSRS